MPIQRRDILKYYAATEACEGCRRVIMEGRYGVHTDACRRRFEERWIMEGDPKFERHFKRHVKEYEKQEEVKRQKCEHQQEEQEGDRGKRRRTQGEGHHLALIPCREWRRENKMKMRTHTKE